MGRDPPCCTCSGPLLAHACRRPLGRWELHPDADTRRDWVYASELGQLNIGQGRLDDDDGAAGGGTTVPPGRDAHDLAVTGSRRNAQLEARECRAASPV